MDNVSVRDAREFLNLSVEQPRMHLLDEPTGYISAMGKSNSLPRLWIKCASAFADENAV